MLDMLPVHRPAASPLLGVVRDRRVPRRHGRGWKGGRRIRRGGRGREGREGQAQRRCGRGGVQRAMQVRRGLGVRQGECGGQEGRLHSNAAQRRGLGSVEVAQRRRGRQRRGRCGIVVVGRHVCGRRRRLRAVGPKPPAARASRTAGSNGGEWARGRSRDVLQTRCLSPHTDAEAH